MGNNITEKGRQAAAIKAEKRAAALRENLKRRKQGEAARDVRTASTGDEHAQTENRQ